MKMLKNVVVGAVAVTAALKHTATATAASATTYTVEALYADDKCTTTGMLTITANAGAPCKASACSGRAATKCSTDWKAAATSAFGSTPCAIAIGYTDQKCTAVASVGVVPIDGACHPTTDGSSVRATLNSDKTITIKTYEDTKCVRAGENTFEVSSDNVDKCNDGLALSVANVVLGKAKPTPAPTPASTPAPVKATSKPTPIPPKPTSKPTPPSPPTYMVVGLHDDAKCSSISAFAVSVMTPSSPCVSSDCSNKTTIRCTGDWKGTVAKSFGNKPYLVGATYLDDSCSAVDSVGIVPIDGLCHTFDQAAIKTVVNGDKTVSLMHYDDLKCAKLGQTVPITSDLVGNCEAKSMVSVVNLVIGKGKATPAPTPSTTPVATKAASMTTKPSTSVPAPAKKPTFAITSFYSTGSCTGTPAALMITPSSTNECANVTCYGKTANACADDYSKYLTTAYGKSPFVSIIAYQDVNCTTVSGGSVVALDGSCIDLHGIYVKASQNADKSVSVKYFKDAKCSVADQSVLVTNDKSGKCSRGMVLTAVNVSLKK